MFDATEEADQQRAGQAINLTGDETTYQVAAKVRDAVVARYGISPEHAMARGDDEASNGNGPVTGKALNDGFGYYAPEPGTGGAQACCEDADGEWAIGWCAGVQEAIDAAGLPLFVEPACGFALNIYPIPCRYCGQANATTVVKETNHLGHWEHELCQSCVESRPRS